MAKSADERDDIEWRFAIAMVAGQHRWAVDPSVGDDRSNLLSIDNMPLIAAEQRVDRRTSAWPMW
jgi:hypothetical protein